MITLSTLRVFGRERVSGALGVFWMFRSRIALGFFEAFLAEYVDLTFPFLNSRRNTDSFFLLFFLLFFVKLNHYKISPLFGTM